MASISHRDAGFLKTKPHSRSGRATRAPSISPAGIEPGALLAAIVESAEDAIFSKDLNGIITSWNKRAESMFGYSAEEIIGQPVLVIIPFELVGEELTILTRIRNGERIQHYETVRLRKDGTRIDVSLTISPIRDRSGNVVGSSKIARDITQQKLDQKERNENAAFLETLVENSPDCIEVLDLDTNLISINAGGRKLLEIEDAALFLRHSWLDRWRGKERQDAEAAVSEAKLGGTGRFQAFGTTRKGTARWWDIIVSPLLDAQGRPIRLLAISRDISESEERFRQLAENIPQLAWMADAHGWIFWYNKRWFEYTGTTLDQVQGWGWQVVHDPEHLERVSASFKSALATGQPWEDTFPLRGNDGKYRWFLSRAFPIRDHRGHIARWFGTNTDITELRKVQTALADREAVLRTVTNDARVGLVMVNKERRYVFANQTYAEILGLPNPDIVGKRVPDLLADVYDQVKPHLDRAFAGERVSYELRVPSQAGNEERIYEVVYEPRIHNSNEPYVVVVIVDITQRQKAQEILEHTVAERTATLQQTIAELEGMSYSLSHDMRAPLRTIRSFTQIVLAESGDALAPDQKQMLEKTISSAGRLDRLIKDVLVYSRVSRQPVTLGSIDVEKLIQQIISERAELQPPNAEVIIQTPLPPVHGHEAYLTQCLTNILDNGVKFVRPGTRPHIRIWSEPTNGQVRLWFADNGIGIPKEAKDRVFGIFQRIHDDKTYPGTGIGLAIVRRAAERMGGSVGVESEPGHGSRFWLQLGRGDKE